MANSSEASVEEILESIKKVIARDNREDAIATRKRRETRGVTQAASEPVETAAPVSEPEPAEDVLDLGKMQFAEDVDTPQSMHSDQNVDDESDAADIDDSAIEQALVDDAVSNDIAQSDPKAGSSTNHKPDNHNDMRQDGALITEKARDSMRENLEALAMLAQPSVPPQIVRSGETSLEGLTRDLLRPMLSEWLDANLPQMVEAMVKEEIARIARKDK